MPTIFLALLTAGAVLFLLWMSSNLIRHQRARVRESDAGASRHQRLAHETSSRFPLLVLLGRSVHNEVSFSTGLLEAFNRELGGRNRRLRLTPGDNRLELTVEEQVIGLVSSWRRVGTDVLRMHGGGWATDDELGLPLLRKVVHAACQISQGKLVIGLPANVLFAGAPCEWDVLLQSV